MKTMYYLIISLAAVLWLSGCRKEETPRPNVPGSEPETPDAIADSLSSKQGGIVPDGYFVVTFGNNEQTRAAVSGADNRVLAGRDDQPQ